MGGDGLEVEQMGKYGCQYIYVQVMQCYLFWRKPLMDPYPYVVTVEDWCGERTVFSQIIGKTILGVRGKSFLLHFGVACFGQP